MAGWYGKESPKIERAVVLQRRVGLCKRDELILDALFDFKPVKRF